MSLPTGDGEGRSPSGERLGLHAVGVGAHVVVPALLLVHHQRAAGVVDDPPGRGHDETGEGKS